MAHLRLPDAVSRAVEESSEQQLMALRAMSESNREAIEALRQALAEHAETLNTILNAPKEIVRDEAGRPVGVRPVLSEEN